MTSSRLLNRLDAAIVTAKTPIEADCLRAERALYLVRLGRSTEASKTVEGLRCKYKGAPNGEISAWLNLVEGLAIYFKDMGGGAFDRVARGYALSSALGLQQLRALTSAWLAQMEYVRHDIDAMAKHLQDALFSSEATAHSTRSRIGLVAAQALYHAGRIDLASTWNQHARDHAGEEGDLPTLSALMHNSAWLGMVAWREQLLVGRSQTLTGEHALMEAESTENFDQFMGSSSLQLLHPLLQAQVFSLKNEPALALEYYNKYERANKLDATSRLKCVFLADKAWCYVQLGDTQAARSYAILAQGNLLEETHIDDRAIFHARMAQVYFVLKENDQANLHQNLASDSWQKNKTLQNRVVDLIGSFSPSDCLDINPK